MVGKELGQPAASAKIIQKVKNTISDRHAAEKLFCDILSEYRAEILPSVVSGWEEMCEAEQEQLTRMNNFFCGLHFLVGLAESAEATLKAWEATLEEDNDSLLEFNDLLEQHAKHSIIADLSRLVVPLTFEHIFASKE